MENDLGVSHKRDLQWAAVKGAVRRLKDNPDFMLYIQELELMQYESRLRSYDPEVKKSHTMLLEETVLQEAIDHILVVAGAENKSKLIQEDDELTQFLEEEPGEDEFKS